jgi:hypothetical protein
VTQAIARLSSSWLLCSADSRMQSSQPHSKKLGFVASQAMVHLGPELPVAGAVADGGAAYAPGRQPRAGGAPAQHLQHTAGSQAR